jgi:hypothetical protein
MDIIYYLLTQLFYFTINHADADADADAEVSGGGAWYCTVWL